jgi:DNA-binding PadR family transcriptional regulator
LSACGPGITDDQGYRAGEVSSPGGIDNRNNTRNAFHRSIQSATFRYIESIRTRQSRRATRSPLELAVLGLLLEQDLHGYELRRRLSQILGPIGRLSFGTLYPALNRLQKANAVAVTKVTESRTGLTTERGRKVYTITSDGRQLFDELLAEPAQQDDDKAFALRLAFARHLSREARMRLLVRRREQLRLRLEESRAGMPTKAGTDDYGHMLMEHTNDMTERDIAWIDQLIAKEATNTEQRTSQ